MKRTTGLLGSAALVFTMNCSSGGDNSAQESSGTPQADVPAEQGRVIGEVSTEWKALGANHKLVLVGFEDPKVDGASCYLSRAQAGGLSGSFGVAEDPSEASIACRQTGPIRFKAPIEGGPEGEVVFSESLSLAFKGLTVTRHYDAPKGTLLYLTRSTKFINGSPKNSLSAITPQTWEGQQPGAPRLK